MQYRAEDADGDYTINRFLVNSAEGVAQAIKTRLRQFTGEWPLDTTEGTPWMTQVLGENKLATADLAIKARILGTPGVTEITSYSSSLLYTTRKVKINSVVQSLYGSVSLEIAL